MFVGEGDKPEVRPALKMCWLFDGRINDGFYCASSLQIAQRIVEDPARYIDGAVDVARKVV